MLHRWSTILYAQHLSFTRSPTLAGILTWREPFRPSRFVSRSLQRKHSFDFHILQPSSTIMSPSKLMATPRRSARLAERDFSSFDAVNRKASVHAGSDYTSMKVSQLRELLRQKGLNVSGNRADLISRLACDRQNGEKVPPAVRKIKKDSSGDSATNKRAPDSKKRRVGPTVTPDIDKPCSTPSSNSNDTAQKVGVVSSSSLVESHESVKCLPRTREMQLRSEDTDLIVIGVDEAGRGPLAGPVVAAAAIVPNNIAGVIDSKKITKEEDRERLYDAIISSTGVCYAVAIVSAQRIDEINILQATLEGMKMATMALVEMNESTDEASDNNIASAEREEISYVITGGDRSNALNASTSSNQQNRSKYYALIDGNKLPKEMPCPAEFMIQGDGREFSIAAASIIAKVTRDRLMHEYDLKYPEYGLSRHKGYPTAAHMDLVKKLGASPIHRRTFAPLKHMNFDVLGNIVT
ncbi:hypothetical protein HJC23_009255 [Cyclotella cryptica]|uniref:Ribonuclease n=1 Tax=Cyclotella cryptica TaxID=29204 RepID=A0ABD3Q669_9STRA